MSFTIARVPITMTAPIPTLIQFFLLIIKILVNSWENRVRTCVTLINSQVPKPFSHLPKKGFYGLCREFYITKGNPSTRASREPAAFDLMKKVVFINNRLVGSPTSPYFLTLPLPFFLQAISLIF